jgi:dimethylargininase
VDVLALALTRAVPGSVTRALSAVAPDPPIDLEVARGQHAAYRAALAALGLEVEMLPADEACPDCQFIEDTAVVAAGLAVITRPGAPSRQPETAAIAAALAPRLEVVRVPAPATIDGGDCMRLGETIYVGRSARTNAAGILHLAAAFAPRGISVVAVDLPPGVLHLKCVCSPLGDAHVLLAEGTIAPDVFAGAEVVWAPAEESYAANCVAHADGVLVSDGFPRTRDALAAAGFRVIPVPTSEARKADGALTCMSIIVDGSR